jgi:hypothetical protein
LTGGGGGGRVGVKLGVSNRSNCTEDLEKFKEERDSCGEVARTGVPVTRII